jgi:hypothetical protein
LLHIIEVCGDDDVELATAVDLDVVDSLPTADRVGRLQAEPDGSP